uniref:CUE domain-containing protein n=1 Tax=Ascaris lumbricoides TaxID=6252 RepID=A0A9J2PBP0_ASCLU
MSSVNEQKFLPSRRNSESEDDQLGQLMSDPELLRQLVADLPGVDPNSQEIQDAVNSAAEQNNLLIISRRVRAWNIAGVASDSSAPPDGMVAQFLLCFSNPSFPSTFVGYLDGDVVG